MSIFLTLTTPSPSSRRMEKRRHLLPCTGGLALPHHPAPFLGISNRKTSTYLQKVFTSSSKRVSVLSPSICLGKLFGEMVRFWRMKLMGILGRGHRSPNIEPYSCSSEKTLPPLCGFREGAPWLTSAKGRPLLKALSADGGKRPLQRANALLQDAPSVCSWKGTIRD